MHFDMLGSVFVAVTMSHTQIEFKVNQSELVYYG